MTTSRASKRREPAKTVEPATRGLSLLPLDRARGLGADVVDDPVHAAHLVGDRAGDLGEEIRGQTGPVGGHAVQAVDGTEGDDVLVGTAVAHDADALHRQEDGEGLPGALVPATFFQGAEKDRVALAQDLQSLARYWSQEAHGEPRPREGMAP